MEITPYLKLMADKGASDLFFCTGTQPQIKIDGVIRPVGAEKMMPGEVKKLAVSIMYAHQLAEFEKVLEMNFAIPLKGVGRFRVNIFSQRGEVSIVIRYINANIPRFEDMNLPPILGDIIMEKRGLVLVVGATGSGKSTTLAAMIGHRNRNSASHILTVEDPLEFIHSHDKSIVQQREVGIDTLSYGNALKNALREAPDVILIGEIRDMETMKYAISYAETGHLCLATLHANNANQAIERIMHLAPTDQHEKLRFDLSMNMRAIVAQQLVPTLDGKGRVAAIEILLNSPLVCGLIQRNEIGGLKEAMKKGKEMGMQSFDMALYDIYKAGKITLEHAIHHADSPNDLRLMIKLDSTEGNQLGSLSNVSIDMN